jgi:hypothetical protein
MRRRLLGFAGALATLLAGAPAGRGEDRVTVRGVYYREASTRVVQPMAQLSKDLPQGFDAGAYFLVDAITSASVAAGASQDQLFTEFRKEVGLGAGKTFDRTRIGALFRESREPDYISHGVGLSLTQGVWENSGTLNFAAAYGHDTVGPNLNMYLDVLFGSVSYTQALSPTLLVQGGYEAAYLDGYQGNPYLRVPNLGYENPPPRRLRHVLVARVANYFPLLNSGVQLHYRFYIDQGIDETPNPWGLSAHAFEARLYRMLTPLLELRLSYRYYSQGAAAFWCNTDPTHGGNPGCYGHLDPSGMVVTDKYYVADPKAGPLATHVPLMQLWWEARGLRGLPFLEWFAAGAFEVSYGYYIQDTRYGNAHQLQTGYSLPF